MKEKREWTQVEIDSCAAYLAAQSFANLLRTNQKSAKEFFKDSELDERFRRGLIIQNEAMSIMAKNLRGKKLAVVVEVIRDGETKTASSVFDDIDATMTKLANAGFAAHWFPVNFRSYEAWKEKVLSVQKEKRALNKAQDLLVA